MDLSFFYYFFILFILLSIIDSTQVDTQCPTSRRLLLFGGSKSVNGGKKSSQSSSPSKSLPSSSPSKYTRSSDSNGLTVYIQPQTSTELGHKVRSYTHLLKSKLYTNEEKARLKRSRLTKKKKSKRKTLSSIPVAKTQALTTTNDEELNRCQALLQIESATLKEEKKQKKTKGDKTNKTITSTKTKNLQSKVNTPTSESVKSEKKVKSTEKSNKSTKTNENRSITPPDNLSSKSSSSDSTNQPKNKRTKPDRITIIQHTTIPFETDEIIADEQNSSVVGRAFHFVKNIFQLSENSFEENFMEDESIIGLNNDQQQHQHHHHSRKLLSITDDDDDDAWSHIRITESETDHSSYFLSNLPKRQLLSVKTNKQSTSSKSTNSKEKKQKSLEKTSENKPKVGWAYRYRISRYLAAQKIKRSGTKNKSISNEDKKKKTNPITSKISKRKLLESSNDDIDDNDQSSCQKDQISDESVLNTENFHPKRQLLSSKTKDRSSNLEETNVEKNKVRRRKKSAEDFTDPIVIVQSYDHGSYKPHVGWQFRYRVSRYIDSLRENIREDQKRLQMGLQDIQGKKSQELSGRRKRSTDKSLSSEMDQLKKRDERKSSKRGIDERTEKHQISSEQKKKPTSHRQSRLETKEEYIEDEKDLDPELRKINEAGRRVGWTYRYRIRRKLDHLKQVHAETGVPFDLATLSGKREKKGADTKNHSTVKKSPEKSKSVVSKTHDEQKRVKTKNSEQTNSKDSELKSSTSDQRTAGWRYRYRIRRKLDSSAITTMNDNQINKHRKNLAAGKRKKKENLDEKSSESINEPVNIDDINDTPVIRYFQRTSFDIFSIAKKYLCLLPRSEPWTFCQLETNYQNSSKTQSTKPTVVKKLKTKKEQRAKQFIRSHITKFGAEDKATERRIDETMKTLYKRPSLPPLQTPPSPRINEIPSKKSYRSLLKPGKSNPEEEIPTEKIISVASQKNKNKKKFQIIGQEAKKKRKNLSPPSAGKTTRSKVELPKTTTPPPPRLRTLSEVIRDEADTILTPIRSSSRTPAEIQEEINETNESIQERKQIRIKTTTASTHIDSTTSGEDENESTSSTDNDKQINQTNKLNLDKERSSSS